MKIRYLFPLMAVGLAPIHAPSAFAQATVSPSAPSTEVLANIDPKALKLLARVAKKYGELAYFSGVMERRVGAAGEKPQYTKFRFSLERGGRGVITASDKRGWQRWANDGGKTLSTASWRPKQYIQQPIVSGAWRVVNETFLSQADFEGALPDLLVQNTSRFLLDPDLRSVSIESTAEYGASQKVIIVLITGQKPTPITGTLALSIGDDLTLRHATMGDKVGNTPKTLWDETYSEIVIKTETPIEFYATIATAPPSGYRRVTDFDPVVAATAPVNLEAKAKSAVKPQKIPSTTTPKTPK